MPFSLDFGLSIVISCFGMNNKDTVAKRMNQREQNEERNWISDKGDTWRNNEKRLLCRSEFLFGSALLTAEEQTERYPVPCSMSNMHYGDLLHVLSLLSVRFLHGLFIYRVSRLRSGRISIIVKYWLWILLGFRHMIQ